MNKSRRGTVGRGRARGFGVQGSGVQHYPINTNPCSLFVGGLTSICTPVRFMGRRGGQIKPAHLMDPIGIDA